jgi:glycolate oxidase subunit GlcD
MAGFVEDLIAALGAGQVAASFAERLMYSYDAALEKALPGAVVLPRTAEEAARAVAVARRHGVPFTARGAGTNLCGGSVPSEGGLVVHLARMNRILVVDPARRRARVEPGVVNLHLQKALEPLGFFYAPDPASQKACTLGGNAGTNAGGPHCLKYGVTSHHVLGLQVVLPDGTLAEFSTAEAGPDWTGLFVGAEGTLGIITALDLSLLPLPESVRTFLVSFPSMESAVQTVTDVISAGVLPSTLEVMDRLTVAAVEDFVHAGYPRSAEAVLLIELDGPGGKTGAESDVIVALCRKNKGGDIRLARTPAERDRLWEGRRGAYPAMAKLAPNVLVEDGVVPRNRLPEAVRRIRAIAGRENLRMGFIAHAGDGNLHPNMVLDERDPSETARVKSAGQEMMRVCVDLGGSISGEHGIGTDKREAMRWLFTPETLAFFRRLKTALDPDNLCNPGKILPTVSTASLPAVQGVPFSGDEVRPDSVKDVCGLLVEAGSRNRPVFIRGSGTRAVAPAGAVVLNMSGLDRVVEHDVENFTITVEAGIPVEALRRRLADHRQETPLEGGGTLGGLLSSPGGKKLRDVILGMEVVTPDGSPVCLGGRVMKNVAGYDAAKIFLGAEGALGAIVRVTLRLYPVGSAPTLRRDDPRPAGPSATNLLERLTSVLDPQGILKPGAPR